MTKPLLTVLCALFAVAEFGTWLAITIRAEQWGGVDEAALVLMVQLGPAAVAALLVSRSIARFGSRRVLMTGLTAFGLAQCGLAILVTSADPVAGRHGLYATGIAATMAAVPVRPAISALLPELYPDGERRSRFQTWLAWCTAIGMAVGPVVVAVTAGGADVALWIFAGLTLGCAGLATGVSTTRADRRPVLAEPVTRPARRPLRAMPGVRPALVLVGVESVLSGAADLLVVVLPAHLSPAAVGWCGAALGAGALIGGVLAGLVSRRGSTTRWIVALAVGAAVATALLPLPGTTVSLAAVFLVLGAVLAAVAGLGRGLLQLLTPAPATAQVFSTVELWDLLLLLAGVTAVPLLLGWWGPTGMVVALSAAVVAAAIPCVRALLVAERRARGRSARVAALLSVREFAGWSAADLETLTAPSTTWRELPFSGRGAAPAASW